MYSMIIRQKLRSSFADINKGDYEKLLKQFAPRVEHVFYGNHALGGTRYTPAGLRKWYTRLATVFPDLRFDLKNIVVNGWPWNTVASIEWTDSLSSPGGKRFSNQGVHIIRIRWGRVVGLRVYCDTAKLEAILQHLASEGISEAASPPIDERAHPGANKAANPRR